MDEVDPNVLRAADEAERTRVWERWVVELGRPEASRRWLDAFAATDAPKTG